MVYNSIYNDNVNMCDNTKLKKERPHISLEFHLNEKRSLPSILNMNAIVLLHLAFWYMSKLCQGRNSQNAGGI
jgi:hypothetical protein